MPSTGCVGQYEWLHQIVRLTEALSISRPFVHKKDSWRKDPRSGSAAGRTARSRCGDEFVASELGERSNRIALGSSVCVRRITAWIAYSGSNRERFPRLRSILYTFARRRYLACGSLLVSATSFPFITPPAVHLYTSTTTRTTLAPVFRAVALSQTWHLYRPHRNRGQSASGDLHSALSGVFCRALSFCDCLLVLFAHLTISRSFYATGISIPSSILLSVTSLGVANCLYNLDRAAEPY